MQLWALKDPDIEKQDNRTHCLGHWVCVEGNLKTCYPVSFSCTFAQDHGSPGRQEAQDEPGAEQWPLSAWPTQGQPQVPGVGFRTDS